MQDLFQKLKMPLIVLAVLIGGYIVYTTFVKQGESSTALLKKSNVAAAAGPSEKLLPLLLKIQNVTLDEKLFLDPVFRALEDKTLDIIPESIGKQNPFGGVIYSSVGSNVEGLGFSDQTITDGITTTAPKSSTVIKTTTTTTVPAK